MAAILERQSVRLGILLAILCAVGAIGFSGLTSASSSGNRAKHASPRQVALVSSWLRRLPTAPGSRVDVTQTPCLGDVLLCVTGAESPRRLIDTVRSELEARGATMNEANCVAGGAAVAGYAICSLSGAYRTAPISVAAGQRKAYEQPNSWASVDATGGLYEPPKPTPLPPPGALASLGGFPGLAMRCVVSIPGGCDRYLARVRLHGSACTEIGLLVKRLVASDFNIETYGRTTGSTCIIAAARALEPGGQDMILLGGSLKDEPGDLSSGVLHISAF